MNNVKIVMICDDNYVMPTLVALRSMVANREKFTHLNISVLGVNLSKYNSARLLNINRFSGITLNVLDKSDVVTKYQNIDKNRHVTFASLLKFFLPKIFENDDKVLYLDSDIIVQGDLSEFFNIDISDKYAAVVKDTLCVLNREYIDNIGINNKFYFNSGVMLLNLRKMREDNITEKLIDYRLNVKQQFMDQDAFNAVIGHNVKYVSYKWNFLNYYLSVMNRQNLSEFFETNFDKPFWKIYDSVVILHIGGKEKCWVEDMGYLSDVWKKYYDLLWNSKSDLKWFYKTISETGRVHVYFKGIKIASYKRYVSEYADLLRQWFLDNTGRVLNLENPKTYNEKMQWLKLYDSIPIKTKLADKYLVRDWISEKIGEKYLTPLLGVYDSFDEIDFDKLPDQFVIKCNHGSGWNIIVTDKNQFDKNSAKEKVDNWMSKTYAFEFGCELHYMNIKPKIIIEQYLNPSESQYEIQLWTFDGVIKFISIETIKTENELCRGLFYPDGTLCEFQISPNHYKKLNEIPSIKLFNDAIEIGKKLLLDVPYVRIDFVVVNDTIQFREMTFTSGSGISEIIPDEYNKIIGDWINLPNKGYNIKKDKYCKLLNKKV